MNKNDFFIGTWKIVAWKAVLRDGTEQYPLGESPIGYLTFTPDGFLALSVMTTDYQHLDRPLSDSSEAMDVMLRSHFSLFSTYEVQSDKEFYHIVEVCSDPELIGTKQIRYVEKLDSNNIIVTAPEDEVIVDRMYYITFRRVKTRS